MQPLKNLFFLILAFFILKNIFLIIKDILFYKRNQDTIILNNKTNTINNLNYLKFKYLLEYIFSNNRTFTKVELLTTNFNNNIDYKLTDTTQNEILVNCTRPKVNSPNSKELDNLIIDKPYCQKIVGDALSKGFSSVALLSTGTINNSAQEYALNLNKSGNFNLYFITTDMILEMIDSIENVEEDNSNLLTT